jgi:hypothetical protein
MNLLSQLMGHSPHPIPPGLGRSVRLLTGAEDKADLPLVIDKKCPKCGETKPDTDFYIRSDGRRMSSWCKSCTRAKDKVNREKRRAAVLSAKEESAERNAERRAA